MERAGLNELRTIGISFEKIYNKRQRLIKQYFTQLSLTYPQFLVLDALEKLLNIQDEVKQIDISEHTAIDVMTVSTILRNLEKQALIRREVSKNDTRAKIVQLETAGINLVQKGRDLLAKIDERFFSVLDEYTNMFLSLLKQLDRENHSD